MDSSRTVYSLLLKDEDGHALPVNHNLELFVSKPLATLYNPTVPPTEAVETMFESLSSRDHATKEFLKRIFSTCINAAKFKYACVLYAPKSDSGKSSAQSITHETLGTNHSKVMNHSVIKKQSHSSNSSHEDALTYVLNSSCIVAYDIEFSDQSKLNSSSLQTFIGDTRGSSRGAYQRSGESNNFATNIWSTNIWPLPATSDELHFYNKFIVVPVFSQYVNDPNDKMNLDMYDERTNYFKRQYTKEYEYSMADKEYYLKILVETAAAIINDNSWINIANFPEQVRQHSLENAVFKAPNNIEHNNHQNTTEMNLLPGMEHYIKQHYVPIHVEDHQVPLFTETVLKNRVWCQYEKDCLKCPRYVKQYLKKIWKTLFLQMMEDECLQQDGKFLYIKKQDENEFISKYCTYTETCYNWQLGNACVHSNSSSHKCCFCEERQSDTLSIFNQESIISQNDVLDSKPPLCAIIFFFFFFFYFFACFVLCLFFNLQVYMCLQ